MKTAEGRLKALATTVKIKESSYGLQKELDFISSCTTDRICLMAFAIQSRKQEHKELAEEKADEEALAAATKSIESPSGSLLYS
jgi:hypothetical protein